MTIWTGEVRAQDAVPPAGLARTASASAALQQLQTDFETGNVDALIRHVAGRIDFSLFGDSKPLSRSQARYVIKNFFRAYPPARLVLEETSSAEGSWFAAGSYWYENEERPLSIYVRLRMSGADWDLREIRITNPHVR